MEQIKASMKVVFVPEIRKLNPLLWGISYLGKSFSCVVALNNSFKAALFVLTIVYQSSLTWRQHLSSTVEYCLLCVRVDMGVQDCILPPRRPCQISVLTWALDLRTQSKPNELWVAECHHPLVHRRAGRATHSPCTGHKLQLQYSPLLFVFDNQMHTTLFLLGQIILRAEGVNFAYIIHAC